MTICPQCGSEKVRLGSSLARHIARSLVGTRKRYCISCRKRWGADKSEHLSDLIRLPMAACFLALIPWVLFTYVYPSLQVPPNLNSLPTLHPVAGLAGADAGAAYSRSPVADAESSSKRLSPGAGPNSFGGRMGADAAFETTNAEGGALAPNDASTPYSAHPQARRGPPSAFWNQSLETIAGILKAFSPRALSNDMLDSILKTDKKTLWDQYGKYFSSKEQARAAYNQAQQQKYRQLP